VQVGSENTGSLFWRLLYNARRWYASESIPPARSPLTKSVGGPNQLLSFISTATGRFVILSIDQSCLILNPASPITSPNWQVIHLETRLGYPLVTILNSAGCREIILGVFFASRTSPSHLLRTISLDNECHSSPIPTRIQTRAICLHMGGYSHSCACHHQALILFQQNRLAHIISVCRQLRYVCNSIYWLADPHRYIRQV
jgi:hypothetical protein